MSDTEEIAKNDYRVLNLVRFALASEYTKKGLKREDICEKVCTSMKRLPIFKTVLRFANEYLNENFGYKLVPMPVVSGVVTAAAKTNQSRKAAVNQMNKVASSKSAPPQFYTLISTLTAVERAKIPSATRDPVRLAIIQAILLIIKLSGNTIEHKHLITALNEIQMCRPDTKELSQANLDSFMEQLKRERYILKDKKNIMDNESVYSWGPRAYVEFQSTNMAEFLLKVASVSSTEPPMPRFMEKALKALQQTDPEND